MDHVESLIKNMNNNAGEFCTNNRLTLNTRSKMSLTVLSDTGSEIDIYKYVM